MEDHGLTVEEIPHRSSKDRKRWCKGKPGREHDYQWQIPVNDSDCRQIGPFMYARSAKGREARWRCRHTLVCVKCHRQQWESAGKIEVCTLNTQNLPRENLLADFEAQRPTGA